MWLDFAKIGRLANIPKVLLLYRISEEQVSSRKKEIQQSNSIRVRREAIEWFLSRLKKSEDSAIINEINEKLNDLLNRSVITFDVYCQIMYEIAKSARKQLLIQ